MTSTDFLACGSGLCSSTHGHPGTCASASGWVYDPNLELGIAISALLREAERQFDDAVSRLYGVIYLALVDGLIAYRWEHRR